MLPSGVRAKIEAASFTVPPIFNIIASSGNISERDMYNTFNMGLGMVFAVAKGDADSAVATLAAAGETAYIVGEVVAGDEGVDIV